MRLIKTTEKKKRGCESCKDKGLMYANGAVRSACPYEECPYHVLDKYDTYEEYMESEDCRILVNEFFQTIPECYESGRVSTRFRSIYSDGDSRVHL